ncbi:MAG: CHASE3 domain-containing protein [Piscinibacter sp.]|nr:CHASE3 domain-containing protein [Piscinibacter sp.]
MLESPRSLATRIRRSAFAFPLVALAGLALLVISETSYWRAGESMDALGELGQARTSIQALHRLMLDAETGQRGYLLTGRKEYLVPYREANEELQSTFKQLRDYFAPRGQAGTMEQLEALVMRKMSELQTSIGLYDEGREESWRALLATDIGKEQMDQIRALSEQLLAEESAKVTLGRRDVYDTLLLNRIGVGAMTALSLLALFMYLRQTSALEQQRELQAEAIRREHERLEREVERRTAQLRELTRHLQTAREDERSRLARELHDEMGALLTAAKLDAARLKARMAGLGPEAHERLAHLNEALNSGIALKRRIIEDLHPSALKNLGLVAALDILVREHTQRTGIAIDAALQEVALPAPAELTVYRLVQEALTNISKYAQARNVRVELAGSESRVHVRVTDDGVGFDPARMRAGTHGLFGMRQRVEAEGGELAIRAAPGQGTVIEAVLPAAQTADTADPAAAADHPQAA